MLVGVTITIMLPSTTEEAFLVIPTAEEAFPCSDSSYPPLEELVQDTTPVSALAHITFSTLICLYFSLEHVIIYAVQGYPVFSKCMSCLINEAVN